MSGGGSPAKESATQTRRSVTPRALRIARMKIVAPPRQTPVSIRSPGTPSSRIVSTHIRRLASRFSPIIVCAAPASRGPRPALARRSRHKSNRSNTASSGRDRDRMSRPRSTSITGKCRHDSSPSFGTLCQPFRDLPVAGAFGQHRAPLPLGFFVVAALLRPATARLRRVRWP